MNFFEEKEMKFSTIFVAATFGLASLFTTLPAFAQTDEWKKIVTEELEKAKEKKALSPAEQQAQSQSLAEKEILPALEELRARVPAFRYEVEYGRWFLYEDGFFRTQRPNNSVKFHEVFVKIETNIPSEIGKTSGGRVSIMEGKNKLFLFVGADDFVAVVGDQKPMPAGTLPFRHRLEPPYVRDVVTGKINALKHLASKVFAYFPLSPSGMRNEERPARPGNG